MVSPQFKRVFSSLRTALTACAIALAGLAGPAQAQNGSIRLLVGFPAGGGSDVIARTLAEKLKDHLGFTVLVDNRAGAGGQLAARKHVYAQTWAPIIKAIGFQAQ